MRPHNNGMAGSLLAVRDAVRKAVRDAAANPAVPAAATGATSATSATSAKGAEGAAPLLTVSGLSVSYGRIRALNDISLSVRSGELVALAGENGAGKTSLVRRSPGPPRRRCSAPGWSCIAGAVVPA